MPTITVDSSMCSELGYVENTSTLTVVFTNGKTFDYSGVPKQIWSSLQVAPSVGKFLRAFVIGKYPEKEV